MDFTTNYCGPYWSDGELQSSVVGGKPGVSQLDEACREHDAAYATTDSLLELEAADNKFFNDTQELGVRGKVYGSAVLYGNRAVRKMAFLLPFAGLAGYGLLSGFGLNSLLPKKRLRKGKVEPTAPATSDTGDTPTSDVPTKEPPSAQPIVYDPVIPFEDEGETTGGNDPGNSTTRYGLYKPLRRKRLQQKRKQKLGRKRVSSPPDNKKRETKTKISKNKKLEVSNNGSKNAKQETLQRSCSHSRLRSGFNYQYCTRCDREFHPGVSTSRPSNGRRDADRR